MRRVNGAGSISKTDLKRSITSDSSGSPVAVITQELGIDTAIRIVDLFAGEMIYIPKWQSICRRVRDKRIADEFTGCNYDELAKRYNLKVRQVRNIIARSRKLRKN